MKAAHLTDWHREQAAKIAEAFPLDLPAPRESVAGTWESIDAHLSEHEPTGHNDPFDTDIGEGGETVPSDFEGDARPFRGIERPEGMTAAMEARQQW